ncbi:hypothetical protein [Trichormus variabilis]|uniref:Uncharacterized protein n=1 Tax=Trichormus variabilis SAG 1403-4b TaxID=447716 RepID=A0A433USA8_ANAVA|nr:hypothetical protein [Trichormus variabilis]MBD2628022.1 hypothetical protein [Trichormus variabilis FACHB-164]RUS96743.1 hypothetical protein DSM107003_21490 [Trichormus variabilis SAG 1403-4b]
MNNQNKKNEEDLSLGTSLIKTISEAGMKDTALNLAEVLNDKLLENIQNETFSKIPIIKSFYSLVKTGLAVRDYLFMKKLLLFISGCKNVDDTFKKNIEDKSTNLEFQQKLGEELINALSMFDQISKAEALSKIFIAYIKDEINYQQFSQYSYILQNIDLNNLIILREFYYSEKYHPQPGFYLSSDPDMLDSKHQVKQNWHLLQGFITVGLISLELGSTTKVSSSFPVPISFPGKLKCNNFGGKFLQILDLLKLE